MQIDGSGSHLYFLLYGKEAELDVDGKLDFTPQPGSSADAYNRARQGPDMMEDAKTLATEMVHACGYRDVLGKLPCHRTHLRTARLLARAH